VEIFKEGIQTFSIYIKGTLYETIALLQIMSNMQWIDMDIYRNLYGKAEEISKMLSGLISTLK